MKRFIVPAFLCLVILFLVTRQFMLDTAIASPGLFQGMLTVRWMVGL